ncbi:serine/threonine protein kinase [Nocardia higoensis]|uniref:non-specific serine/threonine protein kinase n=1 Tax=Nocardia higoensis TaxID=228599 RepID=A0ABS0D5K0_9NOCA|nr:serine/threonine-protein kinase [Nocardia higoensis]MBF6353621.1 serine/threonine protein kinase [Nocardia higoensis]
MPARRVGMRYDLIEEIGFGGMGSVWRGYDTVLDREIAVKTIRFTQIHSDADAAEFAERFRREARITAQIRHHGVPQVYDAVLDADLSEVYLVMELVEGAGTLRTYLTPGCPLPVEWAVAVTAQIATALSYAHALPVVHRDLKPDNILVTPNGTVKIIDFGIAALLTAGTPKLTMTGAFLGSAPYMSPEQAIGAKATPRTDLYALGCILYEMLCGHPVFGGTAPIVLHHHAATTPVPPRELRAEIPAELDRLVLDLLAKEPEQRPSDAAEVYERLLPLLPPPGSVVEPGDERLAEVPDPTAVFRRPNAPLRAEQEAPVTRFQGALPATAPINGEVLEQRLRHQLNEYRDLIGEGRALQAADVLGSVLEPAGHAFGADSPRVLELRFDVALARFIGGDFRKARTEFDVLAAASARVKGFADELTIQCRKFAADCRIELGELTEALSGMRAVLGDVRATQSDGSEMALELRLALGRLLALAGHRAEAQNSLSELYEDLLLLRGSDDPLTRETAEALERFIDDDPALAGEE